MSASPDFGDLRSLLNQAHTPQAWDQLCEWASRWPADQFTEQVWPYMEGHLARWRPEARVVPERWVREILRGESDPPWLCVARTLRLRRTPREMERFPRDMDSPGGDFEHPSTLRRPLTHRGLRHFTRVDLSACVLTDKELQALAAHSHLVRLASIELQRNPLTGAMIAALAEASWMPTLRALGVQGCGLSPNKARALLRALPRATLTSLDLSHNEVGDTIKALRHFSALRELDLSAAKPDWDALRTLAALALTSLSLDGVALNAGVLNAMWGDALSASLSRLSLWECGLGDDAARSLVRVSLPALRVLDLGKNALTSAGVAALVSAPWLEQLRELNLYGNLLDDNALHMLASAPALANLEALRLGDGAFSRSGVDALLGSPHLSDAIKAKLARLPVAAR